MTIKDDGNMRSFDTGATRDTSEGKLSFRGFLSPTVLHQYARFMNMNRLQSDGQLRDSDNWQKGIDMDVYMESAWRHFFEWWSAYEDGENDMAAMCGLLFNVMGYMHEYLKDNPEVRFDDDEPTSEMHERQLQIEIKKDQFTQGELNREAGKTEVYYCRACDSTNQHGDPCMCDIEAPIYGHDPGACECFDRVPKIQTFCPPDETFQPFIGLDDEKPTCPDCGIEEGGLHSHECISYTRCDTCKFAERELHDEPCVTCMQYDEPYRLFIKK